jgi:phenylacetic acid degradation operon negative regulatory protein
MAEWERFHHPDLCYPVIARRVGEELLELLAGVGEILATRGRCFTFGSQTVSDGGYRSAVYRLRKAGMVAERGTYRRRPILRLTEDGQSRRPDVCRPERFWSRSWAGRWYVLAYDVPESQRVFRDTLRAFLKRKRMGCLQRSVWVTPTDIRPEYDDLVRAADVDQFSFLLEATTVLGRSSLDVVRTAWDFERLLQQQEWYCDVCSANLAKVMSGELAPRQLVNALREETGGYLAAMQGDPLLPRELLPPEYMGEEAYRLHREFTEMVADYLWAATG